MKKKLAKVLAFLAVTDFLDIAAKGECIMWLKIEHKDIYDEFCDGTKGVLRGRMIKRVADWLAKTFYGVK